MTSELRRSTFRILFTISMGQIANKLWHELPKHFSFISLDEFVIMPNLIHGIVIIESMTAVWTKNANLSLHSSHNNMLR